ncbi:MAG TPA: UxaA family hydrolase, partial [Clostridiales bacterium]|nr:UxaA family hydrolase [Clostridiales bacterium]
VIDYTYDPVDTVDIPTSTHKNDFFMGYKRTDGKVGIRNEVWIIPTVGCVNDIGRLLATESKQFITQEVDDIIAYAHPYGCSQLGDDHNNTKKILSGLINHPNGAGILVLGLGCENNNIDELKKCIGDYDEDRVKFLACQEYDDEIEQGLHLIKELIQYSVGFKREQVPITELVVGLKCGGSDGYSGITANPTVGGFSDLLTEAGGTTILTEVPEMFGAETILMNRCTNRELFDETVTLINDFKQYYMDHKQPIFENPSPGNKKGGISTLEEKSLGCTQKSGNALVNGVLDYGELIHNKGLHLLNSPGNDLVASTALAASGAHIILFTTGRGTPFGCPVPTIKISSNSELLNKKRGWIDFDAGKLLEDGSLDTLALELYDLVLEVASGKKVKNEVNGYRDIAIFKQGVTL